MEQAEYYDRFGARYRQNILECPEPEVWTTDYQDRGPVFQEMKERVDCQRKFIQKYFKTQDPVFDIGCGFGRQACLLAKMGFVVEGIDTSETFIEIARQLFEKFHYSGGFRRAALLEVITGDYRQVLLLDVLEHIPPGKRKAAVKRLAAIMSKDAKIIISIPHTHKRVSTFINNRVIKNITGRISYFRNRQEHPFPIPGRKKVVALFSEFFEELEYRETGKTEYFIFRRNNDHL